MPPLGQVTTPAGPTADLLACRTVGVSGFRSGATGHSGGTAPDPPRRDHRCSSLNRPGHALTEAGSPSRAADSVPVGAPGLDVVGIGEDGWDGLSPAARAVLTSADIVVGGPRQLALLGGRCPVTETWPSPLADAPNTLRARHPDQQIAVLASGDPLMYGIASTLIAACGPEAIHVHPGLSSVTLACARLGWAAQDVTVVSAVARPLDALTAELADRRRILVLTCTDAKDVAALLVQRGFGSSTMTVLARLGGPAETIHASAADSWSDPPHDPLAVVAVDCRGQGLSRLAGLPDNCFDHDGALTKREVRAITLAALGPRPGELLWDIGAGSGSVGIEWMRAHAANRAVAVESRADRADRIRGNAHALGVPGLQVTHGQAPDVLTGLPQPDAIFIGGGLTSDGVIDACLAALPSDGRLVANAVTVEGEHILQTLHAGQGGALRRIQISALDAVGSYHAFRPALPLTQWTFSGATPSPYRQVET